MGRLSIYDFRLTVGTRLEESASRMDGHKPRRTTAV
jgi:hypothetical protein